MNSTSPGADRQGLWQDRTVRWTLIACGIIVGIVACYAIYIMALRATVEARLDEIRAEGHPVTLEELDAWYEPVPDEENAALVYLEAFALHDHDATRDANVPVISSTVDWPEAGEPWPDEMVESVGAFVADNEAMFERLREARTLSRSRYPVDLTAGWQPPLSHLGGTRQTARSLGIAVRWHLYEGRLDEAIEALLNSYAVAESLRDEPVLVSQLVRISIYALANDVLRNALPTTAWDDASLAKLDEALARGDDMSLMRRALIADRAKGSWVMKLPPRDIEQFLNRPVPGFMYAHRAAGTAYFDHLFYLDIMGQIIDATRLPLHDAVAEADRIDRALDDGPWYAVVSGTTLPALTAAVNTQPRLAAGVRTLRTALAVERYRLATGELPDSLEDLVPTWLDAVPIGPISGVPIEYERLEPAGYRLDTDTGTPNVSAAVRVER